MSASKRAKENAKLVTLGKFYPINDAVNKLKAAPATKFDQTIEVCVKLGIDARKSDQVVRGAAVLPNGTGKTVRVAVFTQGANAEAAKKAGADLVGMDDLAQQIQAGNFNFDVVIASPDAMGVVGRLGQILGPRGLMPNPKVGTVTPDVAQAVINAKGGQVRYRADKGGLVHCGVGKLSFDAKALKENIEALMENLRRTKPSAAKGIYIQKITLSSTMGPGLPIDMASLNF
jgi:large subunit ribosomal protein L1